MDRTITVTGSGTAYAVPDSANVTVAVIHRADSVADAFAGVASGVAAVREVARGFVSEREIGSRGLHLWPAHDQLTGRQSGFECRHTLAITCPKVDVAGSVLSALVAALGNRLQVDGVALVVSDPAAAAAEAREKAYDDAIARATHVARLAGATLGGALTIVETGSHDGILESPMAARDMAFEPGQTAIGSALTVTFAVAD